MTAAKLPSSKTKRKPNGYWTFDRLQAEALKYETRTTFFKTSGSAYNAAVNQSIFDEICSHMTFVRSDWTYETLVVEALRYETRVTFQKGSKGAYLSAFRRGLLDEICGHMEYIHTRWTDEMLTAEALKLAYPVNALTHNM